MDPISIISGISTVVSIIELADKGYKWDNNLTSQIDRAYTKALKK